MSNTYLVFQDGRNLTQEEFDSKREQEDKLRAAGFVHVCGGPGQDQSQWFKEGFSEADKSLLDLSAVIEVSETEKAPLE